MRIDRFQPVLLLLSIFLTACSPGIETTWDAAQRAAARMGGAARLEAVDTLVFEDGRGTRARLGQAFEEGAEDPEGILSEVRTTLDLEGQRAAFEYSVSLPDGFMQHRIEALTTYQDASIGYSINDNGRMASTPGGLFSWGPQNSPEPMLRRNPVTILLEAGSAGEGAGALSEVDLNGNTRLYGRFTASWGEEIGLYFDPDSELLIAFDTIDTERMLGDVESLYFLGDYKETDGLLLPYRLTITRDGTAFSDVRYESVAVNRPGAEAIFEIPDDLVEEGREAAAREADSEAWVPLEWNPVAEGVFHVVAYSHHSMVVEFPTFVAVVEAPYTETQSLALAALITERIPGKPIRYAAVTHPHWDHAGGVRGIASVGATILVASGHENQIRQILGALHTHPPDRLEQARQSGAAGTVEAYDGMRIISEGDQTLELYEVSGSPHVEPVVLAFVPSSGVLFQSDLYFPGTGSAGSPASRHLEAMIRDLGLDVRTLVGGHGGVGPFSELIRTNAAN